VAHGALVRVALSIVLALGGAAPAHSAAAAKATCVTLKQMGVDGFTADHPPDGHVTLGSAIFRLPAHATQGPSTWYVLHIHASISMRPGTTGVATLGADTDGRSAAAIQVTPAPSGFAWAATSLAEPKPFGRARNGSFEVSVPNYLEYKGVTGGVNTLRFTADSGFGARFAAIHIFGDTCVEATPLSPELLGVGIRMQPQTPLPGQDFRVTVHVQNTGTRTINGLRLSLVPTDRELRSVDGTLRTTPALRTDWTATLRFRASSPGAHRLRYSVGSAITGYLGGQILTIHVGATGGGGLSRTTLAWILGVIIAAVCGGVVTRYARAPR